MLRNCRSTEICMSPSSFPADVSDPRPVRNRRTFSGFVQGLDEIENVELCQGLGMMPPAEPVKPHRKAQRAREQRGCAQGGSKERSAKEKSWAGAGKEKLSCVSLWSTLCPILASVVNPGVSKPSRFICAA